MADCYFHGYAGGGTSCRYCEEESRLGLENGSLDGCYEPVPMEQLQKFEDFKVNSLVEEAKKNS